MDARERQTKSSMEHKACHAYHPLNQLLTHDAIFTHAFQFETLSERIRIGFLKQSSLTIRTVSSARERILPPVTQTVR